MRQGRFNAATTLLGRKYIYAFNGVGAKRDLDTIERYSIILNYWEKIGIKTPFRIHNHFALSIGEQEIVILGGKQNLKGFKNRSQTMTTVFVYNTEYGCFKELEKLDFNYKIGSARVNNCGKILLYLPHNKR